MKQEEAVQYFADLDRKLRETYGDWSRFRVKICGKTVELCFPDDTMCRPAMRSLYGQLTEPSGEPDGTFFYWNDVCAPYLPPNGAAADAAGPAVPRLSVFDRSRNRFYYVQPKPPGEDYMIHSRTAVFQFSRWASANDLIMLHSAAVGIDGKGVLIAGRSGSGKTTFAVSCLFAGLDFVSDDYTLLSASGPLQAMPLYTVVGVTQEICRRFPQLNGLTDLPPKRLENGKDQFVIPRQRFAEQLDIKAIILPVIKGEQEPSIHPTAPGKAMIHLLHSSAVQTGREQDAALIRQTAQRLSGLPVYEMHMSTELMKNPEALRTFLQTRF